MRVTLLRLSYSDGIEAVTVRSLPRALSLVMVNLKTMSSKVAELILEGSVPSKKNSRVRTRSGSSIPSKAFYQWQNDALKQLRLQRLERFYNPVSIEVIIYFGTNVRADLDNRLTSILDMLVEGFIIRDDKWQDVPRIAAQAEYRKGQPGAFIRISELADT